MTRTIDAIIVAGGRGSRARIGKPKQYAELGGVPLLRRTVMAFTQHPDIRHVLVVIGEDDAARYEKAVAGLDGLLPPTVGGADRQASVHAGLEALAPHGATHVLIHDGARAFVSPQTIRGVMESLYEAEGAIAALPVADTLKRAGASGGIDATVSRDGLWRAQTPQGFRFETILNAHREAPKGSATDDASLLEALGIHVALVPDEPMNMKLTYKEDFALANRLLGGANETRTGLGYDVHAFEEGDAVILGGVTIPHTHKLKGHSDADVALHALADAIYGALGAGDIGHHFPPSDPQWKGAPSRVFLEHAGRLVRDQGGVISNVDVTLICEAPKIGPHRDAMVVSIAEILSVDRARVSVKATTSEKLGFTGRGEGIACQAMAALSLPFQAEGDE